MLRIIINGVNGKMGQVVAAKAAASGFSVVAGVDLSPESRQNPFPVFPAFCDDLPKADCVVDFSRPEALPAMLRFAAERNISAVVATTGMSKEDKELLNKYSERIPILISANMSLGVNLQLDLITRAASFLGDSYEIEIIEKHHDQKADAPSGTALALADTLSEALGGNRRYVYGRHTLTDKRDRSEIGIHSVRGGTIVGEHEVLFIGQDEIVEVTHRAQTRALFATGALRAVEFLSEQPPGLYSMSDIIAGETSVTRIYTDDSQALVHMSGITSSGELAQLFSALAKEGINIDMISSMLGPGHDGAAFTLQEDKAADAERIIQDLSLPSLAVSSIDSVTKLGIFGVGMERQSGVAAEVFSALAACNIEILAISTSETKITMCVERADSEAAIKALTEAFRL
ncbi:MAG: 4-hydroxy-tetrahydrodipicolinate reductase [Christensenellales bacterium]|jgi:4-hydroxy-tetrahydrodipicolinate reductase